jgi:hypothetical protein
VLIGREGAVPLPIEDYAVLALFMMPPIGCLPATNDAVRGAVGAIEREFLHDGFVQRCTQQPDGSGNRIARRSPSRRVIA